MADPQIRILVAIEFANGGRHQAACRTQDCRWPGGLWRGEAYNQLYMARWEQQSHQDWHRDQQERAVAGV